MRFANVRSNSAPFMFERRLLASSTFFCISGFFGVSESDVLLLRQVLPLPVRGGVIGLQRLRIGLDPIGAVLLGQLAHLDLFQVRHVQLLQDYLRRRVLHHRVVVQSGRADPVSILVLRAVRVRLLGLVDLLIGGGGRDVGALLVLGRVRIVRIVGRLLLRPGGARGKQRGETERSDRSGHFGGSREVSRKAGDAAPGSHLSSAPALARRGGLRLCSRVPGSEVILETRGLSKEFRGFIAVKRVDLRVVRGTIHALIGPNGAGKTTCFNLLTGFLPATGGRITYKGEDITGAAPADVARKGLVRSFQISAVFPYLTALENVRIALQRKRGASFDFWQSDRVLRELDGRAAELLAAVGFRQFPNTLAAALSYGRQRAPEIATTLPRDPALMLLDEPTAGMGHEDVERIAALIQLVAKDRTVLMVEHNLGVVASLSQRITVLARGEELAAGDYLSVSKNPAVVAAYLGTEHA